MNISAFQTKCVSCATCNATEILKTCFHAVCKSCAESLKSSDGYRCNVCVEISNSVISNPLLFEKEPANTCPDCVWCLDNGEKTVSVGHCEECNTWLCNECLKGHNRMPPFRNHSIQLLKKTESNAGLHCQIHPNEALECFCESCGILTCRDCQLSVHRDHGSHRWVGEKANLLATPLENSLNNLVGDQTELANAARTCNHACTSNNDDSFLGSVEKTRLAIEARASSLIVRIRERTESLLKELDVKCMGSVKQLESTELLMKNLQDHLIYTLEFTRHLLENKDSDPVSLVQLYDALQARIQLLHSRVERLVSDAPPSSDSLGEWRREGDMSDPSAWRKETIGWRSASNQRAFFIANWDPEELAKHSGTIAWLRKPKVGANGIANVSKIEDMSTEDTAAARTDEFNGKYDEFLDTLAELDGHYRTSDSNACDAQEPVAGGVGCAICFGSGLLAHCGSCRRAYHLDCHLPRLNSISLVPGWVCGLCVDQDAAAAAHVAKSDGTGLSHMDFLTGCRILMGLLVHAEAVHFTASVCPACSVPLLTPGRAVPHCPAGHLYHRLAELRLQLEDAASVELGGTQNWGLNSENISSQAVSSGQVRLADLDDWLVEVDKFWSDASDENGEVRGATKGCLRAARRLRASLASLVRTHRPQSQVALPSLCALASPNEKSFYVDENFSAISCPIKPAFIIGGDR